MGLGTAYPADLRVGTAYPRLGLGTAYPRPWAEASRELFLRAVSSRVTSKARYKGPCKRCNRYKNRVGTGCKRFPKSQVFSVG